MKKYRDEKTPGLLRLILFIELFVNVKRSVFFIPSSGRVSY